MANSRDATLKSVSIVSLCSFGQLVLQFAFQIVLAGFFGAESDTDAYFAAMTFPMVVSTVLVGSLGYAFIPIFIETRDRNGDTVSLDFAREIAALLILTSVGIAFVASLMTESLMSSLHPGFHGGQLQTTIELFKYVVWTIPLQSAIFFLRSLFHANNRFTAPSVGPLAGWLVTIVVVLVTQQSHGIVSVAIGTLAGNILSVLIHWIYCSIPLQLHHSGLTVSQPTTRCLRLMLPLILGAAYYNLDPLVDRYLTSNLEEGRIAQMSFAWRIAAALITVTASALSMVAFPKFAKYVSDGDNEGLASEIAAALRLLVIVSVPICVGVAAFANAVIHDFFQFGRFTDADTSEVQALLTIYLGVVVGNGIGEITSKVLYSLKAMKMVVIIGVSGFTVGTCLKFSSVDSMGVRGIAAASSVIAVLNAVWMLILVRRRTGSGAFADVGRTLFRAVVASFIGCLIAIMFPLEIRFSVVGVLAVALLAYLVTMYRMGDEYVIRLWQWILSRQRKLDPPTGDEV
ncbi:MAG: hypothetical protein CMJ78_10310 [Planctomycetaceae bacterium]|nr:hypothetical protein [Planctomycetaceae bacterium]